MSALVLCKMQPSEWGVLCFPASVFVLFLVLADGKAGWSTIRNELVLLTF